MYTPSINRMDNEDEIFQFISRYSFAQIISIHEHRIIASHLPFVIERSSNTLKIYGHFAKSNPQWKSLENQNVLFIFAEPHAYISPTHYESTINVPTWNYIAVHVYGNCTLLHDTDSAVTILEKTINTFEPNYKSQWDALPTDYKSANINGIVCFEVKVTEIQAKKKLSQNKKEQERKNIIQQLENSKESTKKVIGEWMKKDISG